MNTNSKNVEKRANYCQHKEGTETNIPRARNTRHAIFDKLSVYGFSDIFCLTAIYSFSIIGLDKNLD
jgi:hypothetical protein